MQSLYFCDIFFLKQYFVFERLYYSNGKPCIFTFLLEIRWYSRDGGDRRGDKEIDEGQEMWIAGSAGSQTRHQDEA